MLKEIKVGFSPLSYDRSLKGRELASEIEENVGELTIRDLLTGTTDHVTRHLLQRWWETKIETDTVHKLMTAKGLPKTTERLLKRVQDLMRTRSRMVTYSSSSSQHSIEGDMLKHMLDYYNWIKLTTYQLIHLGCYLESQHIKEIVEVSQAGKKHDQRYWISLLESPYSFQISVNTFIDNTLSPDLSSDLLGKPDRTAWSDVDGFGSWSRVIKSCE